uniref:Uncharacterized protein n=1 Tax=Plectus sambesii TaxID=2011161 RepID=A0A914V158_9BILA
MIYRHCLFQVVYDKVNKVIGYSLDVAQNTDEPFIGNLSVGTGHIRVVHDFGSGIEYVLSGKGDHCNAVNPLPRSGGDVAPGTGRLEMKNATDFMLGCNSSEFVYLGQRTTDAGLPADVFISKALTNVTDKEQKVISVKTTVTELWYSLSDWTIENRLSLDKTVTLLEIRQYHYTENAPVSRTVQKIQSIVDYTGRSTPWSHFTVASCLKLVDDSYLFMLIKTTLAEITAVGLNNFQDGLAEHVAKIANVSALRFVGNFVKEIKIDSDTHIAAFFNLGDVSAVSGANETS